MGERRIKRKKGARNEHVNEERKRLKYRRIKGENWKEKIERGNEE